MLTEKEIREKLKELQENTNMTNMTKNYHWEKALKYVLEESEEE